MSITIYTGLPGSGKSLRLARVTMDVLWRNFKYWKKTGIRRRIFSNLHFAEWVEKMYPDFITYWGDPADIVKVRDQDVIWDEIATHLDSTQWANMSLELKRWLQQHRKYGVDIYGTTQDFAMIDKSMRRLTSDLYHMVKVIGSKDKSATSAPIKHPWGVILMKTLDPTTYDEATSKQKVSWMWPMMINKQNISVFDTSQEITQGEYPPLRHIARSCERDNCSIVKLIHA